MMHKAALKKIAQDSVEIGENIAIELIDVDF